MKGLLDLLGIDIARFINTKTVQGISVDKDDLILNPEEILPPPHIRGKSYCGVACRAMTSCQVFGKPGRTELRRPSNPATIWHSATATYALARLTMHDSDLIMIDMDPRDPFDFYLDSLPGTTSRRLYQKHAETFGLRAYTRDYNKLQHRTARGVC